MKPKLLFVTYLTDFSTDSGDKIYSTNIINELRKKYDLDLLYFGDESPLGIVKKTWRSVFSIYPSAIFIHNTKQAIETIKNKLSSCNYEYIIFDHFRTAWINLYIPQDVAQRSIYLSHNVEFLCRTDGFSLEKNVFKKVALYSDYIKNRYWELKVLKSFSRCSAISEVDQSFFKKMGIKSNLLKPGYSGERTLLKNFDSCSNNVAWVGSFKYFAKRINLINFCEEVQKHPTDKINFRLSIIGLMDNDFIEEIKTKYSFCDVYPNVNSVYPYLNQAKCGIIYEPVGGGFKLKTLDYVFTKTPIIALKNSCEGTDFKNGTHFIEEDSASEMVLALNDLIHDKDRLTSLSELAFIACESKFNWDIQVNTFMANLEE
jgi:glycosyltransferase involved in cell wall biosynthesis